MIAIAAFGFPMLFIAYLREIGVSERIPLHAVPGPRRSVPLPAGPTSPVTVFADGYDVALGFEVAGPNVVSSCHFDYRGRADTSVCWPSCRWYSGHPGRAGRLCGRGGYAAHLTAAATVIFLFPQLSAGMVADLPFPDGILVEAGIQGAAMPLASAAVGGAFGIVLWFTGGRALVAVVLCARVTTGFGLLDRPAVSQYPVRGRCGDQRAPR